MEILLEGTVGQADRHETVPLRCPSCRQNGSFEPIAGVTMAVHLSNQEGNLFMGSRRCPNRDCKAHAFVVWRDPSELLVSYPPERIDFDPKSIPGDVLKSLEEALTCHSQECYTAAAIMVRRTIEDVCADKGAEGKTLYDRIEALSTVVVLPTDFVEALHNLRLLGNDAAHVDAVDYAQVGKAEVEVAIDVTKEILKSVYQLGSIMGRLRSLKAASPDA